MIDWEHYKPFFRPWEFESPDTHEALMDEGFMNKLMLLRTTCGFKFHISSGYRTPEHNRKVGGGAYSAHREGKAADIICKDPYELVRQAMHFGFSGIGVKQHGEWDERFIHLDTAEALKGKRHRPALWSY